MWWPLLLIPVLVWAVYAIGTPWPDSAPAGVNLETYGDPWNVQDLRAELSKRGHELTVREIKFFPSGEPGGLLDLSGPLVQASVQFDGDGARLYVYRDVSSMREDWVQDDGSLRQLEAKLTDLANVIILESAWGPARLGDALQDLDR
jgi:hypothetical protein